MSRWIAPHKHYHVCICDRRNDKQQALLYTAQNSRLNRQFFKYEHILTSQYYNENKSPAFFHCVHIWAVLCKSPHRDVDMWGGVWTRRFRRAWTSLNFDKEYLFGFETLVFATSGILTMHNQLVTQLENLKSHHMTPLRIFVLLDIYCHLGHS